MEALLGFHVGFWDYATFVAVFFVVAAVLAAAVFILGSGRAFASTSNF